jgi:hypothetical protein
MKKMSLNLIKYANKDFFIIFLFFILIKELINLISL